MGLTGIYSVDSLISRVSITALPDEDKVAQKEAKLEEGEEYIYEPSTYIVSFTATNAEGSEFARLVLNETLDVYFAEFSQKYVNVATPNNTIEKLNDGDYDYIEMMELIESGYGNIVCAQPFGCLPNHIVGKGMIRKLKELYPESNIVPIDYDPGATRVNQENRIKLMLASANKNLN